MGKLATTGREPGSVKSTQFHFTSTYKHIKATYPAYGKVHADRIKWDNLPMFIFICLGGNAFRQAQKYNLDRDFSAMVLTPGQDPKSLIWPVSGLPVIIEWDGSAPKEIIIDLVKCLLRAFAISVTVWPTWVDYSTPIRYYDSTQSPPVWVQSRESIKTYYPKQVQA